MRRVYFAFALCASSAMVVSACASSVEPTEEGIERPVGMRNVLGGEGEEMQRDPTNGLSADVLKPGTASNPGPFRINEKLRERLSTAALRDLQTLAENDPLVAKGLNDPDTRKLMTYLISCALKPGDEVKYLPTDGGPLVTWKGKVGLCSEWKDNAGVGCRELATSCVLSRINGLEQRVPLLMTGDGTYPVPLKDKVRVQNQYRQTDPSIPDIENNGKPVPSFQACQNPFPGNGKVERDCGWRPLYVGRCTAEKDVIVSTPASHCASGEPVMLRACVGLYGCQSGKYPDPAEPYHGYLANGDKTCGSGNGAYVKFKCPSNGPTIGGTKTGYFSIMIAPQDSTVPTSLKQDLDLDAEEGGAPMAAPSHYPSTEKETFTYKEAAFYGDFFTFKGTDQRENAVLYGKMYACYSEVWNSDDSHLAARLCADPSAGALCFPNRPGPCYPAPPTGRCFNNASGAGPAYDNCRETTPAVYTWKQPITTYLNDPCDLSQRGKGCLVGRKQ